MEKFSNRQLMECAVREARLRQRIYKNRILTGRMSQREAVRQISMMEAIAEILRQMDEQERLL